MPGSTPAMEVEALTRQVACGSLSVPAACARLDSLLFGLGKNDLHRQLPPLLPPLCTQLLPSLFAHCYSREGQEALVTLLSPPGPLLTALLAATQLDGSLRFEVPVAECRVPDLPVTRSGQVQLNAVEYLLWAHLRQLHLGIPNTPACTRTQISLSADVCVPVDRTLLRWPHEAGAQAYLAVLQAWLSFFLPPNESEPSTQLTILNSQLLPNSAVGQAMARRLQDCLRRLLVSLLHAPVVVGVNADLVEAVSLISVSMGEMPEWWQGELGPWLLAAWREWPLDGSAALLTDLLTSMISRHGDLRRLAMGAWLEQQELTVQAMLAATALGDRCDWGRLAEQVQPLAQTATRLLESTTVAAGEDKPTALRLVHGWDRLAECLAQQGRGLPALETAQDALCRLYRITEADYASEAGNAGNAQAGHAHRRANVLGRRDRLAAMKAIRPAPQASARLTRAYELAPLVPLSEAASQWLNTKWIQWLDSLQMDNQRIIQMARAYRWDLRWVASIRVWTVVFLFSWVLYHVLK